MASRFASILTLLFARLLGDINSTQIRDLFLTRTHSPLLQRRRARLIISRVRMVAAMFAVLTPMWVLIDWLLFPWPLWGWLALFRVIASAGFAVLALSYRNSDRLGTAWVALGTLLVIPAAFYLASHAVLGKYDVSGVAAAVSAGYAFLPFVMIAGLSVFPITAMEGAAFSTPLLAAHLIGAFIGHNYFPFGSFMGAMWLLLLLTAVATMAGMSQIQFMMALVRQSSHDGLTWTYTRTVGEELLAVQFSQAERHETPLALIFVDLDHFKAINDEHGHEDGDTALADVGRALRNGTRDSDTVIRWGGEEFLIILSGTDCDGALNAVQRIRRAGFGDRPDGAQLTASIGLAEVQRDGCETWQELVAQADARMYEAKSNGRDRICDCEGRLITEITVLD
ncbi:MAG: diguanylate cyclase [Pseudomonadota bacterium]